MTRTVEQIREAMAPLRDELREVERIESQRQGEALVGRCFKYHNSYSGPGERWWYYVTVSKVNREGHMIGFTFQTDIRGKHEIETEHFISSTGSLAEGSGYLPITRGEFDAAWWRLQRKIAGLGRPPKRKRKK